MIPELVARLWMLSLTSSAVLLPLLLLGPWIQKRYTARTCYILWLLLSVRLLLPVKYHLPKPAVTIQVPEVTYTYTVPQPITAAQMAPTQAPDPVPVVAVSQPIVQTISLEQVLGGVWLAGCMLFLLWNGTGYLLARSSLLKRARTVPDDQPMADRLWERARKRPAVLRSCNVVAPMSLGLLRPMVLLPEKLISGVETEMVLRHELGHICRHDLWYKFLLTWVNAVHWFNPLVWFMCRQAGQNLEYCCDDWVVRGRDADFRHSYGEVLLRYASSTGNIPLYATRFSDGQMKGRIMNLFMKKKTGVAMVSLALCAAVLTGTLVSLEQAQAVEGPKQSQVQAPKMGDRLVDSTTGWQWPVPGSYHITVTSESVYDMRTSEKTPHTGTDIAAPSGTQVLAAQSGTVMESGIDVKLGQYILLAHDGGITTRYGTLASRTVKVGDAVKQGQVIGLVGATGQSTGPHLHLEFSKDGASLAVLDCYPDLESQFQDDTVGGVSVQEPKQRLYYTWPVPGYYTVTVSYGEYTNCGHSKGLYHMGLDIQIPAETQVLSYQSGRVVASGYNSDYGKYVEVLHTYFGGTPVATGENPGDITEPGLLTRYANLTSHSVKEGDLVAQGQALGTVNGFLHLECMNCGEYQTQHIYGETPLVFQEKVPAAGAAPYRYLTDVTSSYLSESGDKIYGTGTDGKYYMVDVMTGAAVEVAPSSTDAVPVQAVTGDGILVGVIDGERLKNAYDFWDQREDLKDGVAEPHRIASEYMVTYTNNGAAWDLKKGDVVTITTQTTRKKGWPDGIPAKLGYILKGSYQVAVNVKLAGPGVYTIEIPEDGAYQFTIASMSRGTSNIDLEALSITVSN